MCDDGFVGNPYAGGCLPAKTVNKPSHQTKELKEVKLLNHTTESPHLERFDETTQSEKIGHHLNNNDPGKNQLFAFKNCLYVRPLVDSSS